MNIDQYLNKVKQLADNLEIAGKTEAHTDLVTQVLADLDEDYTLLLFKSMVEIIYFGESFSLNL